MIDDTDLMPIPEASKWATDHTKRDVTTSNISYLIQYGRIRRYDNNGSTRVSKQDLIGRMS